MNIFKTIKTEAFKHKNKIAVKDGSRSANYSNLFDDVEALASLLKKQNINKGDFVAIQYPDSYEYIVLSLAVLSIEAIIAPAPMSLSNSERNELIEKLNIKYLLFYSASRTTPKDENELHLNSDSKSFSNFNIDNIHIKKFICSPIAEYQNIISLNPAFIRFSSGTTGESKGVLISHKSIIERTEAANSALKISEDDTVIWLLDMSYHFVVTILLFLRKGASIIICGNNFPQSLFNELNCDIQTDKCSFIYASPFHYKMLTDYKMFTKEMLSNVRLAISTAMKLSNSIAESFFEKFSIRLSEAYGIIEVGLPFVHYPVNPEKIGTVGKISPDYQIKLMQCDDNGAGQIYLKGPGCFNAYMNPFRTFNDLYPEGWFNTGDIGYIDSEGYLFIVGRKKDLINFAGMKIFPYSVEAVIQKHPDVKEVLVFGEKHETFGEIPCAQIVLNNTNDINTQLMEIKRFCYKNLASFEVPKKINFVDELSKTHSGKIKRGN